MNSVIFDALIIGAGPAGATTALLLAQAGWSVAIVEKKTFPRRKVCGEFISATSLALLQKLGMDEFYLANAGPEIRRVGLYTADTIITSAMPQANQSLNHWGRALGREHLDTALLDIAVKAGASLWQPWTVNTFQRHADLFTCDISSEDKVEQISARVMIMASGSWERGPAFANHDAHKTSDLLAFKAHFKHTELAPDLMPLLAFPGGYGGLVHTDNNRVTLSCCIRRDVLQRIRKKYQGLNAGEAVFQHISSHCLGVQNALSHAQREGNWLAAGAIKPGIRRRYHDGMFFVGNIAGEAHPIIAEGISMAMQSAWLLSQILLAHQQEILLKKNSEQAGLAYTKQWNKHFSNRIHAASVFSQFAMRPRSVSLLLPIIKRFPQFLTFGAKLSGKINQVVPITASTELTASEMENTI
jgi:flavin-dependent dehydrogenase